MISLFRMGGSSKILVLTGDLSGEPERGAAFPLWMAASRSRSLFAAYASSAVVSVCASSDSSESAAVHDFARVLE